MLVLGNENITELSYSRLFYRYHFSNNYQVPLLYLILSYNMVMVKDGLQAFW